MTVRSTSTSRPRATGWLLAAALLSSPSFARASCAGAFCLVNTDWSAQGAWVERGWRGELRYESVLQDRLMRGARTAPSSTPADGIATKHGGAHEAPAVERHTRTRRVVATLDYGLSEQWGLQVAIPFVDRTHRHDVADGTEAWAFRRPGDVRVTTRWQSALREISAAHLGAWGVVFGVKLPTGPFDVRNDAGDAAERSLQPGTGTTDVIAGAYVRGVLPEAGGSWFAQAQLEHALNTRAGYRPGARLGVDLGYRHEWSDRLALFLQLNAQARARDRGDAAEPESSGGRIVALSPGVSLLVATATQVYAYLQRPLHQYVNGTQLAPRWAATVGVQTRF